MKILSIILLLVALVAAKKVKLRDGITPQKLAPIDLPKEVLPEELWKNLRGAVLTNGAIGDGHVEADVTAYAFQIIEHIRTLIIRNGLDPLALSDQEIKLIPVGTIDLFDGWIEELASITLSDKVIAKYTIKTKILELTLPLAFNTLLMKYDYHTQVILVSVRGAVDAEISNIKLNLHMGFNFSSLHAFVDKADIRNSGSIHFKFTGLGPLDLIIDLMGGVLTTVFHNIILSVVNLVIQIPVNSVVNIINEAIDTLLQRNSTSFVDY